MIWTRRISSLIASNPILKCKSKIVIANPFMHVEHGKGILVAELLNKYPIDVILTMKSFKGKGPFYVFSNAAVESLQTTEDTVGNALKNLGILFGDNEINGANEGLNANIP
jgi:predicted Fe-Mo cluster-binding NifX family protein